VNRRNKIICALTALLTMVLAHPGSLQACTACYGANNDSPLVQGMGWGILTLLGVVVSVLGCVALFFVHIGRRAAAMPPPKIETISATKN
jgi:hypothetical protein